MPDPGQLMAKFIKGSDWMDRRNFNLKKKGEVMKQTDLLLVVSS
jgi:hypothetical protein